MDQWQLPVESPNVQIRRDRYSPSIDFTKPSNRGKTADLDQGESPKVDYYGFGYIGPMILNGVAANEAIKAKRKQTISDLQASWKKAEDLKAPIPSGITVPQTALGLLLAAFDHSGRAASGYMQGLQVAKDQEYQASQARFENEERKLSGEIDRQKRWIKILSGQSEYGE